MVWSRIHKPRHKAYIRWCGPVRTPIVPTPGMESSMAARAIANKKYIVKLTGAERDRLSDLIKKGTSPAKLQLKARILLKADSSELGDNWCDSQIVESLETNEGMVFRVRQALVEGGLDAVLLRKKRLSPAVPQIFDGEKEAKLIALACSEPPPGYARWTLRLLEQKVVELHIVDHASDNTIGRTLKKTFSSLTSRNAGSFHQRRIRHL